jgi:UDP-3-O-[3-hydroxymyristoyl] N-acetylglucosamine deacetylase
MGLAKGGSLQNALVFDDEKLLNEGGMRFEFEHTALHTVRFPDECVRHKILDIIGDLALSGHPIQGTYEGYFPGTPITFTGPTPGRSRTQ